jgi:hypothetical protein
MPSIFSIVTLLIRMRGWAGHIETPLSNAWAPVCPINRRGALLGTAKEQKVNGKSAEPIASASPEERQL